LYRISYNLSGGLLAVYSEYFFRNLNFMIITFFIPLLGGARGGLISGENPPLTPPGRGIILLRSFNFRFDS
jgi:hypothetical protein